MPLRPPPPMAASETDLSKAWQGFFSSATSADLAAAVATPPFSRPGSRPRNAQAFLSAPGLSVSVLQAMRSSLGPELGFWQDLYSFLDASVFESPPAAASSVSRLLLEGNLVEILRVDKPSLLFSLAASHGWISGSDPLVRQIFRSAVARKEHDVISSLLLLHDLPLTLVLEAAGKDGFLGYHAPRFAIHEGFPRGPLFSALSSVPRDGLSAGSLSLLRAVVSRPALNTDAAICSLVVSCLAAFSARRPRTLEHFTSLWISSVSPTHMKDFLEMALSPACVSLFPSSVLCGFLVSPSSAACGRADLWPLAAHPDASVRHAVMGRLAHG